MKIKTNTKWFILLFLILLLIPVVVHAGDATSGTAGTSTLDSSINAFFQNFINFLVTTLKVLQKLLWPILLAIGGLLNNDLLFSTGMEERLLSVWVQIRNFVNIGFVVILIGLAIYNVLGIGQDNKYVLKDILPKFVIALIAVNFSFIAMKIILDVVSIVTIAIFAMPASMGEETLKYTSVMPQTAVTELNTYEGFKASDQTAKAEEYRKKIIDKINADKVGEKYPSLTTMEQICQNIFTDPSVFEQAKEKVIKENKYTGDDLKKFHENFFCMVKDGRFEYTMKGIQYFARFNSRNAAMILAVQMMNLIQVDKVTDITSGIQVKDLTFNLLFSVVLYCVYGAAYLALFAVLLTRLIVLWILIAISPIIGVVIVLPNLAQGTGDLKDKFIQNTFAPIKIAIPLTIGYLMLDAYRKAGFSGSVTATDVLSGSTKAMSLQTSGISDLQQFVMAFATVAVVWIGVFSVAEKTMAGPIAGWIKDQIKSKASRVAKLVQYAPLVPAAGGKRRSIAEMMGMIEKPILAVERAGEEKVSRARGERFVSADFTKARDLKGAKQALANNYWQVHQHQKETGQMIGKLSKSDQRQILSPDALNALGAKNIREALKKFKKGGFSADQIKNWMRVIGVSPGAVSKTGPKGAKPAKPAVKLSATQEQMVKDVESGSKAGLLGATGGITGASARKIEDLKTKMKTSKSPSDRKKAEDDLNAMGDYKDLQKATKPAAEIDGLQKAVPTKDKIASMTPAQQRQLKEALEKYYAQLRAAELSPKKAKGFVQAIVMKAFNNEQSTYNSLFDKVTGLEGDDDKLPLPKR